MDNLSQGDKELIKPIAESEAKKLLQHENFRQRTIQIIVEHTNQVSFMKKVKEYAGEEIDNRTFKSVRYWGTVVLTAVLTTAIGFALAKLF